MRLEKAGLYFGIIGAICAVIALSIQFSAIFSNDHNEKFLGIWSSQYEYSSGNGVVKIEGTTEYFNNGTYNFIGIFHIVTMAQEHKLDLLYNVEITGDWEEISDELLTKVIDIRSHPVHIKRDSVNLLKALNGINTDSFGLEKVFPVGKSEKFEILDIDNNAMKLKVLGPKGEYVIIDSLKSNKRYQHPVG